MRSEAQDPPRSDVALRPMQAVDLDAVHGLIRRIELHEALPLATPRSELDDWLEEPHFQIERDARVVVAGGAPVAWGRIWHQPSGEREERAYVFGGVDPDHRRRGIGGALLRWQIARARDVVRESGARASAPLPLYVRGDVYDFQEDSARLMARHGMAAVRYSDQLVRALDPLPDPPALDGIAIVDWEPAHSEPARLVMNDAFNDHWGSTPRTPEAWGHNLARSTTRLDLSRVACEGDRIVGATLNGYFAEDEAVTGRRDGWIMQVGVLRSHRKRGIASALIVSSLAAFRAAGLSHSALGVDSENPTGAYHLYERLGYRRTHRHIVYQLEA